MHDLGNDLVVVDNPITSSRNVVEAETQAAAKIRERAQLLEGGDSHTPSSKLPVAVRMPSGQVIKVGGECLVQALANGGQPIGTAGRA